MRHYFNKIYLPLFISALSATLPSFAEAKTVMGFKIGYGLMTLSEVDTAPFGTFAAQGYVGYDYSGWNVHGFMQNLDLSYETEDEGFKGIYALYGLGAGYSGKVTQTSKISLHAQYSLGGSFSTVSESTGTVQDETYIYSTLVTQKGGNAIQLLVGYDLALEGKVGHNLRDVAFAGLYVGYLSHTMNARSVRIKTNNSDLAPVSPGSEETSFPLSVLTIYFSFDYYL